jgi:DNA helicase-2/ATP-dependent DNA helicase PcrA
MDLSRLNAPQRRAVETTEGPLLVLAGAGSGKTRVITHRIAYLLGQGVAPEAILAVTFTNKAATEMRERLVRMAGRSAEPVRLCTFHAFGAEVLREHIDKLGWPKRFAVADMGDQLSLVKRAMRDRRLDDRAFDARRVLAMLSKAKNLGEPPAPLPEGMGDDYDVVAAEVYPLYQRGLRARGTVDFDDLIVLPIRLLEEHPAVRRAYQKRFRYLLVDEFQDTNRTQMQLLTLLAGEAQNVCAVGDDDQCIYSWRGAEVDNILRFDRAFRSPVEVRLEQNYRSTQPILEVANAVISKNPHRKAKRLWTQTPSEQQVRMVVAPTEDDEARYVAHEVGKLLGLGVPPDEVAILYRTNGQSAPFEEALRAKGVPLEVVGGSEFFDRREVKDVVAYLKVIANPRDDVSLLRIVNVPARGIGDVTLERLGVRIQALGLTWWEAMGRAAEFEELPQSASAALVALHGLLDRYRKLFTRGNLADVCGRLLDEVGFREAVRASGGSAVAADRRLRSVDQMLASLGAYEKRAGRAGDLLQYLNRLALDTREEESGGAEKRVSLMTLHAAKGLEFRAVFLAGVEEDLLPHGGMQGEAQNLEEERRLCYVGMTRAKEQLVLTRCATRLWRGKDVPRTPSRFLEDIPKELLDVEDLSGPPKAPPTEAERSFFSNLKDKLKATPQGPA